MHNSFDSPSIKSHQIINHTTHEIIGVDSDSPIFYNDVAITLNMHAHVMADDSACMFVFLGNTHSWQGEKMGWGIRSYRWD